MFKYLINYVELKTKVASFFPYLYTLVVYLLLAAPEYQFSSKTAFIFLIAILAFDMATTTLNHLVGMQKEEDISFFDQKLLDGMTNLNITMKFNYLITAILSLIGLICGLYLVWISSPILLLTGALCVSVAIIYSYGPVPIKNTCLGELASGITMGYLIPLAFIISQDQSIFLINLTEETALLNIMNIFYFVLIFAIPTLLIANIMLANNACDVKKDLNNSRYTLAVMLGQEKAIKLWKIIYYITYIIIVFLVLLQVFTPIVLISLLTIIPVSKNIKVFAENPVKKETFICAVKNIVIILSTITILLAISI